MVKTNALGAIDPATGGAVTGYQPSLSRAQWAEKRSTSTVVAAGGAWQQMRDGMGRAYYYNASTGVTQWEPPRELRSQTSASTEISVQ